MKHFIAVPLHAALLTFLIPVSHAADTTPPALSVPHTWVEKVGTQHAFKLLLDPQDETGVDKIQYRFKVNSTLPLPDGTAWVDWLWQRGQPLRVQAAAKSMVIEVRALDAAGNPSPLQRRSFASPFPVSVAPNLEPKFVAEKLFPNSGPTFDCRGLYGADFDGDGRDDIAQVDRASGVVKVRKQQSDGTFVSNGFTVSTNAVTDSAMGDFNADGRPDLALVINGALVVYQNDGPDGVGTLQFSVMNVQGLATTGITTIVGIAAGDVTGEGKDDIVISGTGTDTRVAVLLHNDQFQLGASNYAVAYATSIAGPVRLGDVTGDGWNDAVMIDAANNQVLMFMNKGNGSFGGADDVDTTARPIATSTGSTAAQSIAVGDVTGDGRADMVVTKHQFGDFFVTGEFRDNLFVQFFDSRGAAPFRSNGLLDGGFGPVAASSTPFRSDAMLMDLNEDRFPEIVIATPFEGGTGGVRAWRMNCELDNANLATFVSSYSFSYTTGAASPHRLASGRFQSSRADVLLASGHNPEAVQFVLSTYSPSSKTYDLITGASTDSDANGSAGTNGVYSYSVDVGGVVTYSLHYVNNTTTAVTGGVVDCLLPANLNVESADAGHTIVPAGTSKYIRWTVDVPAGTSGVKTFSVRVLSGASGTKLALKGNFKRGTTSLVTKPMPVVALEEPLDLRVTTVTTSDALGQRAHIGETITYRLRVRNLGTWTISGFKLGMSTPANTTLTGTTPSPTIVTGTYPNITGVTWTNLSLLANAELTIEVRVQVKSTTTTGTIIKNTTAAVTRSDLQKVIAPAVNVRIDPPLEITLSADKNIVQPGDIIRYTFTAKNWLTTPFTNAKVVDKLPLGAALYTAAANDALDSPTGNGNFVYSAGTWTAAQLSTTTLPAFDRSTGIMTWVFGTLPAGVQRTIQFDVIVAQDIPTFANIGGVSTTLEVQNKSYNLVGTSSNNARIFAAAPVGGAAANALTATSDKLLSSALTARRSLLSDPPLAAPNLSLVKKAFGDGQTTIGGERISTVINDPSITTDGLCDYQLVIENQSGGGLARGVRVRDYLPANMIFVGNVQRNFTAVPSFVGYRFYDAAGKEMPVIGSESFADTNGNGFFDAGEAYTDANGNKKYDGVTAALVRSLDFPGGDMPGNSLVHFFYRTKTLVGAGSVITSLAGGMSGVKNGLEYTKVAGYHLTADNLHFPVNGLPKVLKVNIIGPAAFDFPYGVVKSRSEMVGTEITQIVIPFDVISGQTLSLSGLKMAVTIPKGYLVTDVTVQDNTNPAPQNRAGTVVRNSAGVATVSFPINDWPSGNALFRVQLDPATKSVLKGTSGQIKAPLVITPTLSGGYFTGGKLKPIGSITRLLGSLPVRDSIGGSAAAAPLARSASGVAAAATASLEDAKIFVGRCAPVSVKRGDTFGYTIFVGNLTNMWLGFGTIEMKIPAGCDYVNAVPYAYTSLGTAGDDVGRTSATSGYTAFKEGTKVTWNIGTFAPYEGGVVTLMLKVRDDFTGNRIDDNTCIFDVVNASGKTPGPLGIVVRTGNETTQSSEIALSAASGLGLDATSEVGDALVQSLALSTASCTITTGGADVVQLNNGVIVIQLGGGRVLTAGPPDKILTSGIRLIKDDAMMRVAAGMGDSNGVQLTKLPTLAAGLIQPTNTLLANLHLAATSLVAAGGGNLVAAGGGNLVAAGGGNLVGNDGASLTGPNGAKLVGNDGGTFTSIAPLVAAGGGNLVGQDGSTLVAAGGGNLVAAGGGNLVAAGGGNLVGAGGSTISPLVAAGGGNLIGQDGASLVAAGGGNLVAAGGGNLVAAGGLNLIPNPK